MALDLLRDCTFFGPALPEPFVKFELEKHLRERQLLPRADGAEGRALQERWEVYRRKLRALGEQGGDLRVASHVLAPLTERLGYVSFERQTEVGTREGLEDGGWLMSGEGSTLRCWSVEVGTDLDAPNLRGRAYRFSPARVAQRVLLAQGERVGLLTDGEELRILLCDPARPDSHIAIRLDQSNGWRAPSEAPDSYRLLLALASPSGTKAIPDLTEAARLSQATVTRKLRVQARRAIEDFIQSVLDQPANAPVRATTNADELASTLWQEGLVLVYRLLFIFKLEASADPARAFSFAATSLWRNTYSPNVALAPLVRKLLDEGAETGGLLEEGLRILWRMFAEGLSSRELQVSALGGMLFGEGATPLLDGLQWGETAVAKLLDALLWTPSEGRIERERVHYGALDVEDLGRIYEALLELEPGIATEPMCRLRRAKLEVVVPAAQGEAYHANLGEVTPDEDESDSAEEAEEEEESAAPRRRSNVGGKTKVQFIESILTGRFYLRVGLGRKASGSYYTPHPFVRFLVQETLGPQIEEISPHADPQPSHLLDLKVLDPAMGSGHFLVEACRFLGEALYEACRLCDELALQAEDQAEKTSDLAEQDRLLDRARYFRKRVEDLPDPDNELVAYLPSRVLEGQESGPSQRKAQALCRRLVAVHCLYGVDKNPLAVELAKLSIWLESYAEGLPLTFLDHRLICGDSLSGPFSEQLATYPRSGEEIRGLFVKGLTERLGEAFSAALGHIYDLESSVGKDLPDLERKRRAKIELDRALEPFRVLAAAWGGGVMLGTAADDNAYLEILQAVAENRDPEDVLRERPSLRRMVQVGNQGIAYDLVFPEVFLPGGDFKRAAGFDAVLGNPPWDAIQFKSKEFLASFDLTVLDAPTVAEREESEVRLLSHSNISSLFSGQKESFERMKRINDRMFHYQKVTIDGDLAGRQLDLFRVFMERNTQLLRNTGFTGVLVPSAFHANAGATGVRQLYTQEMSLKSCFSFENRRKIFDIHSSFKFATVVAQRDKAGTDTFSCAFYLNDPGWLFETRPGSIALSPELLRRFSGPTLAAPELRTGYDYELILQLYKDRKTTKEWLARVGVNPNTSELPMLGSDTFHPVRQHLKGKSNPRAPEVLTELWAQSLTPLREGKNFDAFDDLFGDAVRYLVFLPGLVSRPRWYSLMRFYRLAYREVARATDERTGIFCFLPPPNASARNAASEIEPWRRPNSTALWLLSVGNTFIFDYLLRQRVGAHVTRFVLDYTPLAAQLEDSPIKEFLAHGGLRLSSNHKGYSSLWKEQVGNRWRETTSPFTWPALACNALRWKLRAAMDAIVAAAYGLSRERYFHVLSAFSHKSFPDAPMLCLAAFEELRTRGLEDFARRYDPYWDIPLNENLPEPAIDLPNTHGSGPAMEEGGQLLLLAGASSSASSTSRPLQAASRSHSQTSRNNGDAYRLLSVFLYEQGEMTSRNAQDLTGLDANAVRPYLERLVAEGLAVKEGQRRGTRYRKIGS